MQDNKDVILLQCYDFINTGLVSVPFPPLLNGVCFGIVELFKWAAIGETRGQLFMGEVPNSAIKYFIYLEYDKF